MFACKSYARSSFLCRTCLTSSYCTCPLCAVSIVRPYLMSRVHLQGCTGHRSVGKGCCWKLSRLSLQPCSDLSSPSIYPLDVAPRFVTSPLYSYHPHCRFSSYSVMHAWIASLLPVLDFCSVQCNRILWNQQMKARGNLFIPGRKVCRESSQFALW